MIAWIPIIIQLRCSSVITSHVTEWRMIKILRRFHCIFTDAVDRPCSPKSYCALRWFSRRRKIRKSPLTTSGQSLFIELISWVVVQGVLNLFPFSQEFSVVLNFLIEKAAEVPARHDKYAKSPVKVASNQNRTFSNWTVSMQKHEHAKSIGWTWVFQFSFDPCDLMPTIYCLPQTFCANYSEMSLRGLYIPKSFSQQFMQKFVGKQWIVGN